MSLTNDDLLAISQLLDAKLDAKFDVKLQPFNKQLDSMESKLEPLCSDMQEMKADTQDTKADMQEMKADLQDTKADMQEMKADLQDTKADMQGIKREIQDLRLTIENETNANIKLLAENHGNLIDKLNQAIKVSDKTAIYEIQVNILTGKVDRLEKELAEIKNKIA